MDDSPCSDGMGMETERVMFRAGSVMFAAEA